MFTAGREVAGIWPAVQASPAWRLTSCVLATLMLTAAPGAELCAQNANVAYATAELDQRLAVEPFEILEAKPSRGLEEEVGLRARVRFADGVEMTLKVRPAGPGASEFNNEPRYELAAYRIQSLFLDPDDYVVPPTALRMMPLATLKPYAPAARPTFRKSDDVLVVLQYWMENVAGKGDILDVARFAADPEYARRFGSFNLLTYAIDHGDSNLGNVLISTVPGEPRAWAVDNGVAFDAPESDRGNVWSEIRVPWLPAAEVGRLRTLDEARLEESLAVLAQWRRIDGRLEAVEPGANLSKYRGVRIEYDIVQLGLKGNEIRSIARRIGALMKQIDKGRIEVR